MSARRESLTIVEKGEAIYDAPPPGTLGDHMRGRQFSIEKGDDVHQLVAADQNQLKKGLKGRHMQMIAIGGAIGAGLFVGTGSALISGGPGSVVICFIIIGMMMFLMMQALCELAVMYPVNGAFYSYVCRFMDPSWGFAVGWNYGLSWLTVLPFEVSAACNIINYWPGAHGINVVAWIIPLLVALTVIQFFGVKGYGEVEFVLSVLKILACTGFIIVGVVIDCGGVSTDTRGYIGAKYWHDPGAFANGFKGFCSVFVTASFAYQGTELTGLAAAETPDPRKEIPKATRQVLWRIAFFYIVNLFIVGLIVPYNSVLLTRKGAESLRSPFVIALEIANIKALPSIFNAVILISVMSVANSCSYGSTRTFQALAANGMGPKLFAYVDKAGRPLATIVLQLVFGLLAFINEAPSGGVIFNWLLALSGLSAFFVYASICISHIRFRSAWKYNGHSVGELPFRAQFGVWGSYVGATMNILCLIAQFYVALYPVGGPNLNAENFFQSYLAAPVLLFLYLVWKVYSWFMVPEHRPLYVPIAKIDIYTGLRDGQLQMISGQGLTEEERRASIIEIEKERKKGPAGWAKTVVGAFI